MQNGGFVNKIQGVRLSVAKIHRHVFENPGYTVETFGNRQAAKAILADARETKKRLSTAADSLKICDDPLRAKYGYRKIKFVKHKFVMLYRMQDDTVIVDGMFHELQVYEGIFTDERSTGILRKRMSYLMMVLILCM